MTLPVFPFDKEEIKWTQGGKVHFMISSPAWRVLMFYSNKVVKRDFRKLNTLA